MHAARLAEGVADKFRPKGKAKKKSAEDRFIPIPAKLVWKSKRQ
jgi:hypothetical protein